MCLSVLPACMCSMHVPGACRGQKRGSDPLDLELELGMVIICHMGAWDQNQYKSIKYS